MNSKVLLVAIGALVAIWGAVAGIMRLTEKHTTTPEKVLSAIASVPWMVDENSELSDEQRRGHLDKVIAQVNLLDFEQRRRMREVDGDQEQWRAFMESLSDEEKGYFMKETVEQHFKSVMKAFNQMSREERQRIVDQARKDMQRNRVEGQNMERLQERDEKVFEQVVEKGLGAYYEEASAETKMDLAPLMEEMQQRINGMPRRRQ
jgi:hypothetical protein